eukprot:621391_1
MAVIIAGCNPALQETLQFHTFQLGGVNRVQTHTYSIGGKGQASARAIHSWNNANPSKHSITCHLLQFMGGQNADTSEHKDDTNTQIHGTEIVKPSPFINKRHQTQFIHKIESLFKHKDTQINANVFQISGTIPNIDPSDNAWNECNFYHQMIMTAKLCTKDMIVVIDAYKHLPHCMKKKEHDAEIPAVDILKINIHELLKLIGVNSEWDHTTGMKTLSKWIDKFNQIYFVKYLILTDGGNPSYCFDLMSNCYWKYEMPIIRQIINPIGCGDTCTGILSSVLSQTLIKIDDFMNNKDHTLKWNWTDSAIAHATRWGLAAACAATQTMKLGEFDPHFCVEMFDKIKVSKSQFQQELD